VPKLLSNPASYQPQYGPPGWPNAGKALAASSVTTNSAPKARTKSLPFIAIASNARTKNLRFIALQSPSLGIAEPHHPHAHMAVILARAEVTTSTESMILAALKYEK
jgi:hypothetical protein